jgi:dienelactone hydrolase
LKGSWIMKPAKAAVGVLIIFLAAVLLLLPAFFTERSSTPLVGPDLSALRYHDVQFDNGGLQLAGMIFVPEGEGPFPVAVIIHGSGTSRRASKWYLSVARHLQEKGIAVLLPDKRGSERSQGNWIGADFEELAGDTMAAVQYVRDQELFIHSGIGLVGMSQGGWIAPIAAARDREIAFVVSMSGASVTTDQQLLHEEICNISHFTWPFVARLLAPITTRRLMKMEHIKPYAGFDPVPFWKQVEAPVFFAFGQNDENIPVNKSIKVLRKNLSVKLIKVYPDGEHAIIDRETGRVQGDFLDDLTEFIRRSTKG